MTVRLLKQILQPQRIAVVGASNQPGKVGHTVFRNLITGGFEGVVYPINSQRDAVQGVQAYRELSKLPHPVETVIICTPAETVAGVVADAIAAGAKGAVVLSAGFREVGAAGALRDEELRQVLAGAEEFRLIGPNCLGFMVPRLRLNASFAADLAAPGQVAFVSQSGALCTSVLDWALREGIGFSHFLSIGNMLDVGFADLIDYLAADPQTQSLIVYIESIESPREFMSAARAFARTKPLVAFKAGRFAESAQAAASHTGALAGVDAVYAAAFERAGIVRVEQIDDLLDCARLLARPRPLPGPRLAILTNAGGPGVIATDALLERSGELARLDPATIAALEAQLPEHWSRRNPIDLLGDAPPQRLAQALASVLADAQVDGALVILTPQAMTAVTATAQAVIDVAQRQHKPVLAAWMGGARTAEGSRLLAAAGVPTYETPEQAIRAFQYLVSYGRNLRVLHETPREIALPFRLAQPQRDQQAAEICAANLDAFSAADAKALLSLYEIPVAAAQEATSRAEAQALARQVGFPVALKLWSPQIQHKTDVGGVALDLADVEAVGQAYDRMIDRARSMRPDAEIRGVTVEPMVVSATGVELILGAKQDPVFGSVVLVGMGGVTAELLRDVALGLPPLNERLARRMLQSLRGWPLLNGYRGRPPVAVDKLLETLLRFSALVAECPQLREFDINPLLATPDAVIALDARATIDRAAVAHPPKRFAHLAIRPYPDEWTRPAVIDHTQQVVLRPIKPEDEPLWHDLLARCSERSIHYRFRYLFRKTTHEMAVRFCYVDYDRELPIVVEIAGPPRELIGVARLVADPDHECAEFAVLVADAWQQRGLGGMLLDYALEIASRWGLKRVYGETSADNRAMLHTFRSRGFELQPEGDSVLATRMIEPA
ncbi:MAG: GNAT family N-acetyltransferase [Pirellulales bacterium]|nr:GNAT family N-acetyltransferase [Pirellulales bacterium]